MSLEIRAISTTVSCSVSSNEGHLSAEVDSRAWGYNGGRSTYYDGDDCYIMVYKSSNVNINDSFTTSGTLALDGSDPGWHISREGIAFNTPIANSSKPLIDAEITGQPGYNFVNCDGPEWATGSTVLRLTTWNATLKIDAVPPAGFVFIEYTPKVEMWKITKLVALSTQIVTQVSCAFFGITSAKSLSFKSLT